MHSPRVVVKLLLGHATKNSHIAIVHVLSYGAKV
jgi:hypothetical protein